MMKETHKSIGRVMDDAGVAHKSELKTTNTTLESHTHTGLPLELPREKKKRSSRRKGRKTRGRRLGEGIFGQSNLVGLHHAHRGGK